MESVAETLICDKCNCEIDKTNTNHSCYYEKKLNVIRQLTLLAEEDNNSLTDQNKEIKKLIEDMEKEINDSFNQLMETIKPIKEKLAI